MKFNDGVYVGRECPFCGEYHEVLVSEADFAAWQGGELAQDAFPYLSADEREILISGICPTCWDRMFGSNEEPDPDEVDIHGNTFSEEEEDESDWCDEDPDNGWEL